MKEKNFLLKTAGKILKANYTKYCIKKKNNQKTNLILLKNNSYNTTESYKKADWEQPAFFIVLILYSVNANLFSVSSVGFELNFTIDESKQCVIFTDTNIVAGVEFSASLTNNNIAGKNLFTAEFFNA